MVETKDAVVLSAFIPDMTALGIGFDYIDFIKEYFRDADVYIGMNPSAYVNIWLDELKKEIPNVRYATTEDHLVIDSDASSYQTACKLLSESPTKYNLVYFMHTKGVTSRSRERYTFFNIFKEKASINEIFLDKDIGSYSYYIGKHMHPFKDVMLDTFDFKRPYFYSYLYFYTFYVLRGEPLQNFLKNCNNFFYKNLITDFGGDRYYYERDFPQVVWRQGYKPAYIKKVDWNNGITDFDVEDDWKKYVGKELEFCS